MIELYGFLASGNVYKIRLLLAQFGIAHQRIEVSQPAGQTAFAGFRKINSIGKVPVVRLDDGRILTESGAILYYFAQRTAFWPSEVFARAHALRWMFFEQYSHEPPIAGNRYMLKYMDDPRRRGLEQVISLNRARGAHALQVMDDYLAAHRWFTGDEYGVADIALYAYTHVAAEAEFDLSTHSHTKRWLSDVRDRPGHISLMQETSILPVETLAQALA